MDLQDQIATSQTAGVKLVPARRSRCPKVNLKNCLIIFNSIHSKGNEK